MPCVDNGPSRYDGNHDHEITNRDASIKNLMRTQGEILEVLAQRESLLCGVLTTLLRVDRLVDVRDDWNAEEVGLTWDDLMLWWRDHQERDRRRMAEIRKSALAKLTPEEIRALGITGG
jgi:hypothetical protein